MSRGEDDLVGERHAVEGGLAEYLGAQGPARAPGAATQEGLRPPARTETRKAVRDALECPVDSMGADSNQDIAQAVFDAADGGCPLVDLADFWMPDSRDAYERMIAAHGRIPTSCQACSRLVRMQKKAAWLPRTNHWPLWSVRGRRGNYVRPHCYCAACICREQGRWAS